jgi:hypothetical protein
MNIQSMNDGHYKGKGDVEPDSNGVQNAEKYASHDIPVMANGGDVNVVFPPSSYTADRERRYFREGRAIQKKTWNELPGTLHICQYPVR